MGHVVAWLRHYAKSQKVMGSIPDEISVIFFNLANPSSCSMALGSTEPLTEISTRNLGGGKGWPVSKVTSSPPSVSCPEYVEASMSHKPMGFHDWLQG
jgi:hypothetical protein